MASTRRVLERVPIDRLDWKPHPEIAQPRGARDPRDRDRSLGPSLRSTIFRIGSEKAPALTSTAGFLARFDENVSQSRAAIARKSDAEMAEEFQVLRPDGEVFFALSRRSVLRRLLLNHLIHHRGQLTVYLRLNDVPLPSVYGPTADEAL